MMKRSRTLLDRRLFLKNTCAAGAVLATANFCSGLLPLAAFASSAVIEQRTESAIIRGMPYSNIISSN